MEVYYVLYANDYEMPLIQRSLPADSVAPPHSPTSIKLCISRVEKNLSLADTDLFADTSSDTPLKESHIFILRTDGPGPSPNEPMAIVQAKKNPGPTASGIIPDGKYVIKEQRTWIGTRLITPSFFSLYNGVRDGFSLHLGERAFSNYLKCQEDNSLSKWDITLDTNGSIFMRAPHSPSSESWVGAEFTNSTVAVPWRLFPADSKFLYLATDMNRFSQNPLVPVARGGGPSDDVINPGERVH